MPKKYQNPKLETRTDVKRHYYFIRVSVPARRQVDGGKTRKREPKILGFVDEISYKEAMKRRSEALELINAGRVLIQSQFKMKDIITQFQEIRVPQLGVPTQAQYRCQIENHILPAFGELRMCDVDRPLIEQFLTSVTKVKSEDPLGWWARNNLRSVLSAIFATAKDWKLWEGENPTLGIRLGRKRFVREKRLLTVEQLRTLLAVLPDRLKFLVLVLFGLGLRISEALGLRWSDLDFDAATISIRRRWYRGDLSEEEETKTEGSTAEVRLSPSMLAEFAMRYPGPQARKQFIFMGDDSKNPPDDRDLLRFEFRPILVRLGLYYPGFGWHAFRRQNITWKQQIGGATLIEAQKAGRHASLDMTYVYTLPDKERETAQQQAMFDHILGLPGETKH